MSRRPSPRSPAVLGLLLAATLACSPAPERPARAEIRLRFIPEDPRTAFDRQTLFDEEEVFRWRFATAADLEPWEIHDLTAGPGRGPRWRLEAAGEDPRMIRGVAIDAAAVHGLEVTLGGLRRGKLELFWAAAGSDFSAARSLALDPPGRPGNRESTLTFDLAAHPGWRGEIERLRLDPTTSSADTVEIRAVRGLRRRLRPEGLEEAASRPWKLELDSDVRNALLAVPGRPLERTVAVAAGDRLRFSFGLEPGVRRPVTFTARAERRDGSGAVLFDATLDPGTHQTGRWHDADVPLDGLAGDAVTLRLEARAPGDLDLAHGLPLWANPEVFGPRSGAPAAGAPGSGLPPPNVLLISIDTLRADRLSAYGHFRRTSPHLDAWAESSAVLFRNAVAQAPWTLPSQVSMLSGLDALRHGVNHPVSTPRALEMLPETLRRHGYATAAVTGGGYLRPQYGFTQGFDSFAYWPQILSGKEFAHGLERMERWLDAHGGRPFFLFFHTYEVHYPHRRREPYFSRLTRDEGDVVARGDILMRAHAWQGHQLRWRPDYFVVRQPDGTEVPHLTDEEKVLVGQMYDSAIAYVDDGLGRLFRRLERLGLLDETLVIVTSDHGEALGEDDRAGHNYLEDWNALVPLLIAFPDGRGAGTAVDAQVRSIDIVPTVLEYLGIPPAQGVDGVSLLAAVAGDPTGISPEAWTYASSANYGLGLRYANRLKYTFNNAAWKETFGEEALFAIGGEPEDERRLEGTHPRLEALRRRVRETFADRHRGLRMRIANAGPGKLAGRLTGGWAGVSRVKAADAGCKCLRWHPRRGAVFEVPAGREVLLLFEGVVGDRAGVTGAWEPPRGSPVPFRERFDPRGIEDPVAIVLEGREWRRLPAAGVDVGVGFTVWNEGGASVPAEASDNAARDQLRALGYLD